MNKKISFSILLACLAVSAHATFYPVSLTGFNEDIVANGLGNASASTTRAVDFADYAFVSEDFKVNSGDAAPSAFLPANGLISSAATAGVTYQLASYTGNNVLQMGNTTNSGALALPAGYIGDVYILGTTGSGNCDANIVVKFTDNTSQSFGPITFPDWFGGTGYAVQNIGRILRSNNGLEAPAGDPRLYERKLTINASNYEKEIASIEFTQIGKGVLNIMAVTICQVPKISAQPKAEVICEHENAGFSTVATETNVYQWQVNTGSGFVNIVDNSVYHGSSTPNLQLIDVPASFNGNFYRCELTSTCGATVHTQAHIIDVTPAVSIVSQPVADTSCIRGSSVISITHAGTAVKYQWQVSTTGGVFQDVPAVFPYSGTTSPQLSIAYTEDTLHGKIFRCLVDGNCNSTMTNTIQMVVLPSPYFSTHPKDVHIVALNPTTFSAGATGNDYVMYWQASTDGVNYVNINDNALYSGTKTGTLKIKNVLPANDGDMFRCILKSTDAACVSIRDTSDAARLTIDIPASVGNAELGNKVTVYPNPVAEMLNISGNAKFEKVRVYSLSGQMVLETAVSEGRVDVSALAPGVYAAIFSKEGEHYRTQFVKK